MKILVYGSGGREHAVVKGLKRSPSNPRIFVFPGNDGMLEAERVHLKSAENPFQQIAEFCNHEKIDFVFVGPEDPLCQGLSNVLREKGIAVVGPDQTAAQLEASKIFSKNFMLKYGIPTARAETVSSVADVEKIISEFQPPYVLKADGLAAGKGVVVSNQRHEILSAADEFFNKGKLGAAATKALFEEGLTGWEISVLVLTNGKSYQILPLAQDHKRLQDNDEGPNTGGMGTVAPLKIPVDLQKQIEKTIVEPSIKGIANEGWLYRGVLFIGIMVTERGPLVLEYNVRFGDPETQVVLPLIENDLAELFKNLANGELETVQVKDTHAACVVMAAPGYPDHPEKGVPITGNLTTETENSYFVHAGTKQTNGVWQTNGGRVLGAIGLGATKEEALNRAYTQAKEAKWQGQLLRTDIGKQSN